MPKQAGQFFEYCACTHNVSVIILFFPSEDLSCRTTRNVDNHHKNHLKKDGGASSTPDVFFERKILDNEMMDRQDLPDSNLIQKKGI